MMGGVLFLVTAVAGLLTYYQVEHAQDSGNSTIAIFAADAGLERALYYYFYEYTPDQCDGFPCELVTADPISPVVFTSGVSATSTITIPPQESLNEPVSLLGSGVDAGSRTVRALEMSLTQGGR